MIIKTRLKQSSEWKKLPSHRSRWEAVIAPSHLFMKELILDQRLFVGRVSDPQQVLRFYKPTIYRYVTFNMLLTRLPSWD